MNEEVWQAIVNCDPTYDGKFFYGVNSTGIFCRPSCKSKNPRRANVRIFLTTDEAVTARFRPCKRCRPDHLRWPDEDLVAHAIELIENRYPEPLTLFHLANILHISPYHLHRTFKRVAGQTPAEYLRTTRLKVAKELLSETDRTITDVAVTAGFPNAAHFSTVFQKQFGLAPTSYRGQYEISSTRKG